MPGREVRHTTDFDRIVALPRRVPTIEEAQYWADEFTQVFRRPGSVARLRPWQGYACADLARNAQDGYGAVDVLPVGTGKTWITYMAPRLVGAKRPVLIIPAALKAKTLGDFTALYKNWDNRNVYPEILTVESLARESGAMVLLRKKPDFIGIDECDVLANPNASTTRRLDRYIVEHEPIVNAMTGTLTRNSILGYWHIVMWCLRDRAPLPLAPEEAAEWADALDNKKVSMGVRTAPGPLGSNIRAARAWYRDRFVSTPGVLVVDEDSAAGVAITVRTRLAPEDAELDAHFKHFLVHGEILGGIPRDVQTVKRKEDEKSLTDPFSRFRIDGQLGLGLFQYWAEPAPKEWSAARSSAAAFVRAMIEQSSGWSTPIDTEAQCFRRYPEHPAVLEWLAWKPRFRPDVRVKWISDSAVRACEAWIAESRKPGIVWCGSVEFATRLAERTGLPMYGRKGLTASGASLHAARPTGSIICSWHANKRGFNLQAWPRQLITLMPPSAKWVEQIIGRSHRAGAREAVVVDVLATSGGTLDAFEAMLSEARFEKETIALTKKVLRARIERATPEITESNKFRWARA